LYTKVLRGGAACNLTHRPLFQPYSGFFPNDKREKVSCAIGNFGHVADALSSRPKMPTFGAVVKT
ncbi:MAG: hypothetical protein ACTTIH_07605, partial [Porphyromonas gingivalis]